MNTATLIKKMNMIHMYEITEDESGNSHGFFVVHYDECNNQVRSIIDADCPASGGVWISSGVSAESISYVSNPRKRPAAQRWFRKLTV